MDDDFSRGLRVLFPQNVVDVLESPITAAVAIAVLVAGFGILLAVVGIAEAKRRRLVQEARDERELATIEEDVRMTGFGAICLILLILAVAYSFISAARATTVFQQIASGISFIGSMILFGSGAAMGRRRIYRVFRSERAEVRQSPHFEE